MNKFNLLTYVQLASGDAVDKVNDIGLEIIVAIQRIGITGTALSLALGATYMIFGGDNGRRTAVRWFVGALAGLFVLLAALVIAQWFADKATF